MTSPGQSRQARPCCHDVNGAVETPLDPQSSPRRLRCRADHDQAMPTIRTGLAGGKASFTHGAKRIRPEALDLDACQIRSRAVPAGGGDRNEHDRSGMFFCELDGHLPARPGATKYDDRIGVRTLEPRSAPARRKALR